MSKFIARIVLRNPHDTQGEYRDLDERMAQQGFIRIEDGSEPPPARYRLNGERDPRDYIDVRQAAESAIRRSNPSIPFVLDIAEL